MKKNRKNKNRVLKFFNKLVAFITLIMYAICTFFLIKLNVLPSKYLILFIVIFGVLTLIILLLSFYKKLKKGLRIFILILGLICSALQGAAIYYLNTTNDFIKDFTETVDYEIKKYYIIVLKTDNYKSINDIKNTNSAYVNMFDDTIADAKKEATKKASLQFTEYEAYDKVFSDLKNNTIESFLISESYYTVLFENEEESEYAETTTNIDTLTAEDLQILDTIEIKEKIEVKEKSADVTTETFNVYISGMDSYGNVNAKTRSDVNILASINPKSKQVLLINIPRDYYVNLGTSQNKDKLTHAGVYGIDMSVSTIENLFDIDINYYFKVNYGALVDLVNTLGGVDVYSEYSFTSTFGGYRYQKGYNHVNGKSALEFVRTRKAFNGGDRVRGQNQQAMIKAVATKMMDAQTLVKYNSVLDSISKNFATNISSDDIKKLVKMQLADMAEWNIQSYSVSGSDSSQYTYSYPSQKLYVMIPDEETITDAKNYLNQVKNGDTINVD